LKNRNDLREDTDDENSSGPYTIFHALFEAMKDKDKKQKKKN